MAADQHQFTPQQNRCNPQNGAKPLSEPGVASESDADTDAEVIAASMDRPEEFAVIFDRYATVIHRYLARRCGTVAADDLLSETFLVAFEQRSRYDQSRPRAIPWLYGIASNLLRRDRRSEARQLRAYAKSGVDPVLADVADHVAERVDAGTSLPKLAAALAGLSSEDRTTLLLSVWEQLSHGDIAAAMDVPTGTVGSRLSRARKQIRTSLGSNPLALVEETS
jgi:RNA polymerase sigma factor (sigma-70 family)